MKRKSVQSTVTYSSSSYDATAGDKGASQNITINPSITLKPSTNDYPWTAYYITTDEFFDILKVAFDDTYGSDHKWHPEDLYINVSCVLEVVSNTLANMVRVKAGKSLRGVKE